MSFPACPECGSREWWTDQPGWTYFSLGGQVDRTTGLLGDPVSVDIQEERDLNPPDFRCGNGHHLNNEQGRKIGLTAGVAS